MLDTEYKAIKLKHTQRRQIMKQNVHGDKTVCSSSNTHNKLKAKRDFKLAVLKKLTPALISYRRLVQKGEVKVKVTIKEEM